MRIDGTKGELANPARNNTLVYFTGNGIGPIANTTTYLIKVISLGSHANGVVGATFRQAKIPYAALARTQNAYLARRGWSTISCL